VGGRPRGAGLEAAAEGRCRVVIEGVRPELDGGRFPIKRTLGERVVVEADVFADGHDAVACAVLWRGADEPGWSRTPMQPLVNDRWRGGFSVTALGPSKAGPHLLPIVARVQQELFNLGAELAAGARYEHAAASRGERIGVSVLHRCFTRGSAQQTPCSSGSAASYSSVTR